MKQSTNYNMNKPDPNDMFSLEHWNQNTDKIDETLAPTFEDYTGETPVPTTDEALKNIKSKTKLSILMQNIKAFCKGCCTLGMLVDNCVTNNNNLPLAASQGKILMDQITSLNNNLANKTKSGSATISTKQNDSTALQIRFDEPFPSRPYVTVSLNIDNANTNTKISVFGIDQTGFKVSIYDTAATTRRIEWIASV